jgi:S1-C subfamily serine protease
MAGDSILPKASQNRAPVNTSKQRVVPAAQAASGLGADFLVSTKDGRKALKRKALLALQKEGAQAFIRRVNVRPAFHRGKFHGWRVLTYSGPGHLQSGDIVSKINGRSIERPAQFMAVWQSMASGERFIVDLVRGGKPLTISYPIVD